MRFGLIAQQASRIAQEEAREAMRVAGQKALLGALSALFLVIAITFAMIGLFVLLRSEVGAVLAAFCIAGGSLLLAIVFLLLSLRVQKKTSLASHVHRVEAIADQAAKELQSISPYLVLGAFVLGVLKGKK